MNWYLSLPSADAVVPCGNGSHTVRWTAGRLTLPGHPDAEAELVLGALGGDKPACVTLAESWARHADDLAVLTAGPRSRADRVTVTRQQVEEQRAQWRVTAIGSVPLRPGPSGSAGFGGAGGFGTGGFGTGGFGTGPVGMGVAGASGPGGTRPPTPAPQRMAAASVARHAARTTPGRLGGQDFLKRAQQRLEVLELLTLGPAFQFRLSGAVAAAWASAARAGDRGAQRPALTAALTGRFAPVAAEWLGIDPDEVTVTPHEGDGWGTLAVTGAADARQLRASLPVSWLSEVWACGFGVLDGHLAVGVTEPGFPRARVLALPAPGADPVVLDVEAADAGADVADAGADVAADVAADTDAPLPRWSVLAAGR
jgi:hypothetical protein